MFHCFWIWSHPHRRRPPSSSHLPLHSSILLFFFLSPFKPDLTLSGAFVGGSVGRLGGRCWQRPRAQGPEKQHGHSSPSCSSSQAGFCSDSGSQSYRTTSTYLTFFSKIHPFSFGNVCNATEPRKKPSCHHPVGLFLLSRTISPLRFSASAPVQTDLRRPPDQSVTSLQNRLLSAWSESVVHITECGLMTNECCSLWV